MLLQWVSCFPLLSAGIQYFARLRWPPRIYCFFESESHKSKEGLSLPQSYFFSAWWVMACHHLDYHFKLFYRNTKTKNICFYWELRFSHVTPELVHYSFTLFLQSLVNYSSLCDIRIISTATNWIIPQTFVLGNKQNEQTNSEKKASFWLHANDHRNNQTIMIKKYGRYVEMQEK